MGFWGSLKKTLTYTIHHNENEDENEKLIT